MYPEHEHKENGFSCYTIPPRNLERLKFARGMINILWILPILLVGGIHCVVYEIYGDYEYRGNQELHVNILLYPTAS